MGPLEPLLRHMSEAGMAMCGAARRYASWWSYCTPLNARSKAKEVLGIRSRRASSPGQSRALWQNRLAGPINEVTTAVMPVGARARTNHPES